tara:strand:- start:2656 stop:3861 length:1206 start_codon:yes stop_codon:yes gene_type:complete
MNLNEMRDKEERVFRALGEVLDGASGRSLTAEEAEKVERMNAEADELQGRMRSAAAVEAAEMRLSSARGGWNMSETQVEKSPETDFRGFARGDFGREFRVGPSVEGRALPVTGGAAPNAAPLAPLGLYERFVTIMDRMAPMRTVCAVDTFATSDIRYPQQASQVTVDDDTAEGAAFDNFEPTFGSKTPTPRKFAVQTSVTNEAVNDSFFSLEDVILQQQAEALAAAQNAAFMLGTGVDAGDDRLFADHTSAGGKEKVAASATKVTLLELVSGLCELASTGYFGRPGAFVVSPGMIDDLMTETADSRPILQPQAQSTFSIQSPFQVFGRPVYVASEGSAMTTGKHVAAYVTQDCARIADVQGINFLRDPYTLAASGQINLLASIRSGFAITEARGIVTYKTA